MPTSISMRAARRARVRLPLLVVAATLLLQFPAAAQYVNNPATEPSSSHQSGPSLARLGTYTVAAFAASETAPAPNHRIRCSYSTDDGATWTQLGAPPAPAGFRWVTDPRVVSSPVHGKFFVFGGANNSTVTGAVYAFVPLEFPGGVPTWGVPRIVRVTVPGSPSTPVYAHDAIASPVTGRLFAASYLDDGIAPGMDVQYSDDAGATWSAPVRVAGFSALLRWHAGHVLLMDMRGGPPSIQVASESTPAAWSAPRYVPLAQGHSAYMPYLPSGALPAHFDVDGTGGPHDGRLYAAWHDAYVFGDDPVPDPATARATPEIEPNNTPATATPAAVGDVLRGVATTSATDLDHFSIHLEAGERLVLWADSLGANLTTLIVDVLGSSATSSLMAFQSRPTALTKATYVAPLPDDYRFRVKGSFSSGVAPGYRVRTAHGFAGSEAPTDQNDIVAAWSDDEGLNWSTPQRVNATPIGQFEIGPVVQVASDGRPLVGWWGREPQLGSASAFWRASRSLDAGTSWQTGASLTRTPAGTDWSAFAGSVYAPNAMLALPGRMVHVFTELQPTSPLNTDLRREIVTTLVTFGRCGQSFVVSPGDTVRLDAEISNADIQFEEPVTFQPQLGRNWPVGPLTAYAPSGTGTVGFDVIVPDTAASGSVLVQYAILHQGNTLAMCSSTIEVHSTAGVGPAGQGRFGIRAVSPNPARGGLRIHFALERPGPASLEVFDLLGRHVATLARGPRSPGDQSLAWAGLDDHGRRLNPGVYVVELRSAALRDTRRVVLIP